MDKVLFRNKRGKIGKEKRDTYPPCVYDKDEQNIDKHEILTLKTSKLRPCLNDLNRKSYRNLDERNKQH